MVVLIISDYYSGGMGYTENMLPKYLSQQSVKVYLLTTEYNVYGTSHAYDSIYKRFLGNAKQKLGVTKVGKYVLIRAKCGVFNNYLYIKNIIKYILAVKPDVIHCTEVASINFLILSVVKWLFSFQLHVECHQHLSVVDYALKSDRFYLRHLVKKTSFYLTKWLPVMLASRNIDSCFAISADCKFVASKFYGVPDDKIRLLRLGTDIDTFSRNNNDYQNVRKSYREQLGYKDSDIVCIYTGRFSEDKNPLLLGQAIESMANEINRFKGLFLGAGPQGSELAKLKNCKVLEFMPHFVLRNYYFCSDLGVWPTQESMSMIDAMASGLPIIVSSEMGDRSRLVTDEQIFSAGDRNSLAKVLCKFANDDFRSMVSSSSVDLAHNKFNWYDIASEIKMEYTK